MGSSNCFNRVVASASSRDALARRVCLDNPTVPKHEQLLPEPRSPYAVTKLDGEYYCRQYTEAGRLETVAFRYFDVIGPRQDPSSNYASAVPIFIRTSLVAPTIDHLW